MTAHLMAASSRRRISLNHPLLWLLAFTLAHIVLRVALAPALKWDAAEQMLWSQQLALGYGPQPPLYTWLQWGVNQLVGPSVLAVALLKQALIALAYVCLWLAARELLDRRGAWWAAASLMLLPSFGWRVYIDLSHTVLAVAMACALWAVVLRLLRAPRPARFALLGAVCAGGLLAKYNFAVLLAALLLAALSLADVRRALFARGWWWAPLVGCALVLPHALWLLQHLDSTADSVLARIAIGSATDPLQRLLQIGEDWGESLGIFGILALAVFGRAWWRQPAEPAPAPRLPPTQPLARHENAGAVPRAAALRLLWRTLAVLVILLLLMAYVGGVEHYKDRWLTPLLCMVPLVCFAARPGLQRLRRGRAYTAVLVALALAVMVAVALRPWNVGRSGTPDLLAFPITELGQALRHAGVHGTATIVTAEPVLAGTLRTVFPHARVQVCRPPAAPDVAACVAAAQSAARAAQRGFLLLSCDRGAAAGWWREATAAGGADAATRTLQIPYHFMPADHAVLAQCRYRWQPAGASS